MTQGGIKPFQWRPPAKLYDDIRKVADRAGTSMNYEVSRLVRRALDAEKNGGKR